MLKPLLFALALALTAPAAFAQTAPATPAVKTPQYEHCILVLGTTDFSSKNVRLEYGQDVKGTPQNPELIQANAAVIKLASVVAALNYMSSQGWECINVNTLVDASTNPTTGYLLRRVK